MNRTEKAELIETLQSTLNASTTVVVAHQVGMTVAESGDLRQKMREAGAGFKVTKNRIAKLALKGTRYGDLESIFAGPTTFYFSCTLGQLLAGPSIRKPRYFLFSGLLVDAGCSQAFSLIV